MATKHGPVSAKEIEQIVASRHVTSAQIHRLIETIEERDRECDALRSAARRVIDVTGLRLDNPSGDLADDLSNVMQAFLTGVANSKTETEALIALVLDRLQEAGGTLDHRLRHQIVMDLQQDIRQGGDIAANWWLQRIGEAKEEISALKGLLNTPETQDFDKAVPLESAHQVKRWGAQHDAGKNPEDWFWLVGYLAGKALAATKDGNSEKAKHHTISAAAALRNWHAHIRSGESAMRPGISVEKAAIG